MLCKVTKEEAVILNVLTDQASSMIGAGISSGLAIVATAQKSPCMTTSALVHASANQLLSLLMAHRKAHGEFNEIDSLGDLKKRSDVILALVGDLNEIFAGVLRGLDSQHDYLLNLFQVDKVASKPEKPA